MAASVESLEHKRKYNKATGLLYQHYIPEFMTYCGDTLMLKT